MCTLIKNIEISTYNGRYVVTGYQGPYDDLYAHTVEHTSIGAARNFIERIKKVDYIIDLQFWHRVPELSAFFLDFVE
jgi:hypothetical protein